MLVCLGMNQQNLLQSQVDIRILVLQEILIWLFGDESLVFTQSKSWWVIAMFSGQTVKIPFCWRPVQFTL